MLQIIGIIIAMPFLLAAGLVEIVRTILNVVVHALIWMACGIAGMEYRKLNALAKERVECIKHD